MIILSGHLSPETAYVVNDYPYGFRLRCKIRYWLEIDPKRGTRFCSQTTNPKFAGEAWNAPKKSTYCYLGGAMYLDENKHVQWSGWTEYSDAEGSRKWLEQWREGLTPEQIKRLEMWIKAKEMYTAAREKAEGKTE